MDNLPCPHCGGTNLTQNLWETDSGEVDALECADCYAGAPVTSWNKRTGFNKEIKEYFGEEICELKMKISMRGARMQILHDLLNGVEPYDGGREIIIKSWFDKDGVPK